MHLIVSGNLVVIYGKESLMDKVYLEYAEDILSGRIISNQYIKLACKRFLDDLNSSDYYFNEKKYETILAFTGLLKHYTSGASGKPFILEPWQKFIVANLFCLYRTDTNRRKYKSGYISVARKNGKTTFASALAIFALVADGEQNPSCLCAANSREQAKIDYDCCTEFIRQLDPSSKRTKILRNEIKFKKNNGSLKVLAADPSKLDGSSPSFVIQDEVHESPDSKLFDVLRSGQGFREQPLMLSITTAGFRIGGFCHSYENYCKEVLQGSKRDDTLFAMIYSPDEGDDWTDENTYIKSNPNLGVTVKTEWLNEQVNQAKNSPTLETGVKTKNLNMWVSSSSVWIPEHIIRRNTINVDLSEFKNKNNYLVYLGFDLAAVSDLTALSVLFIDPDTEEYIVKTFYYLPKTALDGKFHSELYKMWSRKGYLVLTDSSTTDYHFIQNEIKYLYELFDVQGVYYDSWNATSLVNDLTSEGLPMYPYSQAIGNFNRPTKEFERLILSDKFKIDNNPINRFCIDNCELKVDINGNCKPTGDHQQKKIDGVISMLNALGGYLTTIYGDYKATVLTMNNN